MTAKTLSDSDFPDSDLWVFGYGSLIWKPGFEFVEQRSARLSGEHRSLCIYSMVHRGTYEKPGLVLGLDRGGACQGVAFRVSRQRRAETVAYLREREQVTSVYREVMRSVWLDGDARERVRALAYVADRGHTQYAGRLTLDEQLRLVRQGHCQFGPNSEYVHATVKALETRGIRDTPLHHLAALLHGGVTAATKFDPDL
jgi:cation transport protein ChaC